MPLIVLIVCKVCGGKRRRKVYDSDFGHWFDNLTEPVRCHSCGNIEDLEMTIESDGR